jgi:peptidyl-prolyl cis-trans isomerase D
VREKIVGMPAFQREGAFSPALYRAAVQSNGMSPSGFEQAMRRDMLVDQLVDVIRRGVHVSEEDAFRGWSRSADKIALSYIAIPTSKFDDQVKVEDEALTKWFDDHARPIASPKPCACATSHIRPKRSPDRLR